MKPALLCAIISLVYSPLAVSQVTSPLQVTAGDSVRAWELNREAHQEFDNGNPDRALFLSQSSIQEFYDDLALAADNFHLLATIYRLQKSTDNAIKYYLRAIADYEKLNSISELAQVYSETGDYFYSLGAYMKAPEYYQKAYNLVGGEEARNLLIKSGTCYLKSGELERSYEVFIEVLRVLPYDAYKSRLEVLSDLSAISNKFKKYDQSLQYDKEILDVYIQLNDSSGLSIAWNNIAFDYSNLGDYSAAIEAFKKSLSLAGQYTTDTGETVQLLVNIGICYQRNNDYDNALLYLQKAYALTDDKPYLVSQRANIENILAITYFYMNDLYNAGQYSKNSIYSAQLCNDFNLLETCYYTYSQILKAGNDFIRALDYYEMHLALKDSLERENNLKEQVQAQNNLEIERTEKELRLKLAEEEMTEIQLKRMKLEAEKKQKELDLLRKQRELEVSENERIVQSLLLTRKEHEAELREQEIKSLAQEKAIKELQLKQKEAEQKKQEDAIRVLEVEKEKQSEARKRTLYTLILSTLIGILILVLLVLTRKKNAILARQKNEIEEKNSALEEKNEEILTQTERIVVQKKVIEEKNLAITDSIQYAKRIQEAVLTPVEDIEKHFADSFILFRPRDIVSGDFYWSTLKGNKTLIAAADCTGHGVPGAFMSMLGTTFLSEITVGGRIPGAASILDKLRNNVITALRQQGKEGEAQDGMDIALCIIEDHEGKMNFAGANNPLYYIRDGEIHIIKGDRMPIGIHINAGSPFTDHTMKIEKDDAFYIFSDGMADQFGGPDNKKLKNAAMQQLLLSVSRHPFARQKELIEKAFDEWMGENEQVDDILLIGFRV